VKDKHGLLKQVIQAVTCGMAKRQKKKAFKMKENVPQMLVEADSLCEKYYKEQK